MHASTHARTHGAVFF